MTQKVGHINGVGNQIEWNVVNRPGGQQETTRAFFSAVRETLNQDTAVCVAFPEPRLAIIAQCAAHPLRLQLKKEGMLLKTTRRAERLFYWVEALGN